MVFREFLFYLLLIITLVSCGERKIVHNLSEIDANRLIVRLNRAGIEAHKSSDDKSVWSVEVPAGRVSDALVVAEDLKLRRPGASLKDLSGLFVSKEQREFALQAALSRSLEDSFLVLPGVREAKVHLNLPPKNALLKTEITNASGSASVLIMRDVAFNLDSREIKSLVAGATGLSSDVVSVWLLESSLVTPQAPRSGGTNGELAEEASFNLWQWGGASGLGGACAALLFFVLYVLRRLSSLSDELPALEL